MRALVLVGVSSLLGCRSDDACSGDDDPALELGRAQPGAFVALDEGETVEVADAPQGGFGVPVRVRTQGLSASNDSSADILLQLRHGGELEGDFDLAGYPLLCERASVGGSLGTQVVPLYPWKYGRPEDIEVLLGETVELSVQVTDDGGRVADASIDVVLAAPE